MHHRLPPPQKGGGSNFARVAVILPGILSFIWKELMKADARLVTAFGHGSTEADVRRSAVLAIGRIITAIVTAANRGTGSSVATGVAPTNQTSYVVTQTEEERGFTVPSYDADDVKRQLKVLSRMFNLRIRAHGLPSMGGMKKQAFWVQKENCWPDPARVPLETMRRDPTDSALTLFRRMANGVATVAAGEKVPSGIRDEGAGDFEDGGVTTSLWLNGNQLIDLLAELEEVSDRLSNAEMAGVTAVMHDSLHKSTLRGQESASLAMSRQICKVTEYVAQQKGISRAKGEQPPGKPGGGKGKRAGEKVPQPGGKRQKTEGAAQEEV